MGRTQPSWNWAGRWAKHQPKIGLGLSRPARGLGRSRPKEKFFFGLGQTKNITKLGRKPGPAQENPTGKGIIFPSPTSCMQNISACRRKTNAMANKKIQGEKNTWRGGGDAAGRTSMLMVLRRRLVAPSDGSQRFSDLLSGRARSSFFSALPRLLSFSPSSQFFLSF